MWNYDACIYNCLAQKIFNLDDPANSLGQLSIHTDTKTIDASVAGFPTSAVYLGDKFGCQLTPADKVGTHSQRLLLSISLTHFAFDGCFSKKTPNDFFFEGCFG